MCWSLRNSLSPVSWAFHMVSSWSCRRSKCKALSMCLVPSREWCLLSIEHLVCPPSQVICQTSILPHSTTHLLRGVGLKSNGHMAWFRQLGEEGNLLEAGGRWTASGNRTLSLKIKTKGRMHPPFLPLGVGPGFDTWGWMLLHEYEERWRRRSRRKNLNLGFK